MSRQFGPQLAGKGITFRLWAPAAHDVELILDQSVPMAKQGEWFECHVSPAGPGTLYRFRIDGELEIADPASQFQPDDVWRPSEVIDHNYAWANKDWKGRPWEDAVILELHVGTFTTEGTYCAATTKLDHIVDTGITAIELMPLADFPGRWNWGYDGVHWFAPDSSYGRPEDLKRLIDAAHARELMVFLDVVYSHFGPEGNDLSHLAPQFFSDAQTPWGLAINYSLPEARRFVIENGLFWLDEYRFDGLRLDAVHALTKPGEPHILRDLSVAVGQFARQTGRHIHLVLENDDNAAHMLNPCEEPPHGHYRGQWNDDYHHAWHVLLTGERHGYYADYQDARAHIVRSLTEGFSYQGEPSLHRHDRLRGEPSTGLPPKAFVNFLQNHDQIGNRARGDRLAVFTSADAVRAAQSVLLLAPFPPLLFMGEEWGATEPFPFFCDFRGDLAEAVRKGRHAKLTNSTIDVPDPLARQTRDSAVLDWDAVTRPPFNKHLQLTQDLMRIRRQHVIPLIRELSAGQAEATFDGAILQATWSSISCALHLIANLSDAAVTFSVPKYWGNPIWGGAVPAALPAWSVYAATARHSFVRSGPRRE